MRAESVSPVASKFLEGFPRSRLGEFFVRLDSQLRLRHIICRDKRRFEVRLRTDVLGLIGTNEVEMHHHVSSRTRTASLQFFHRLLQYLAIQIKSDVDDMPALSSAENVSGSSDLQISHSNFESRSKSGMLFNGVDSPSSRANCHHVSRKQKVCVGLVLGSPNSTSQLIQIGQTEPVCSVDDNGVRVRNVQATLDDGCRNQHIRFPANKLLHNLFQLVFVHLAMPYVNSRARTKQSDSFSNAIDCFHSIMEEVNLPVAMEFTLNRVANDSFVVAANHRLYRKPVRRRRLNDGHVLCANERQIECSRNRGSGKR